MARKRNRLGAAATDKARAGTNLMLANVAIRAGSYIARRAVERGFLRRRFGARTAREIVQHRTLGKSLVSFGLATLAKRSLPGALIVGGGALAKALYDRRKGKRRKRGDQARSDD